MNHFMEIAKMRAARMLWAKLVKGFNPKNPKSMALRTHSQTSGWSLAGRTHNNVIRTCIEALAAALGHTQSLHTNALDEAIALPTDSRRESRATRRSYLQEETGITQGGGSVGGQLLRGVAHARNHAQRLEALIQEVERLGGMVKAIETGIPKMRIEEAAARRQARIDSGKDDRRCQPIQVGRGNADRRTEVDNTAVRESQMRRLAEMRATRDNGRWTIAGRTDECAENESGNLLELA